MHIAFALPTPAATGGGGGTEFIHAIAPELRGLGHHVEILEGGEPSFPPGALPVVDGMLLPHLHPRLEALVAADAVALIHHVGAAAGRDDAARADVLATEREMLTRLRRVIATSDPVAARLQSEFGIAAHAVLPGARDLARSTGDADTPLVLAVGVLTRRKGHDRLLQAMSRLTDLPWRLTIAGSSTREPAHAGELAAQIEALGLSRRATLLADPDPGALEREWAAASLFALATRWEGYASAVAEALRRGVPVVVTDGGAAGALVTPEAGAVCALNDAATFGKCLRRLLFDRALRADMAEVAWRAGQDLPGWAQRAQELATILRS